MKSKVKERVQNLGLREIGLGTYVSPATGLFHVCRDDVWLNEEDEIILDYKFYQYGVVLNKESYSELILNNGDSIIVDECFVAKLGVFIKEEDDKERFMFLPERLDLKKDNNPYFDFMLTSMYGIQAERDDCLYFFSFIEKDWISLNGEDFFDEIIDYDDFLYCRRDNLWSMYFLSQKLWWKDLGGQVFFEDISYIESIGIRVKVAGNYRLYAD